MLACTHTRAHKLGVADTHARTIPLEDRTYVYTHTHARTQAHMAQTYHPRVPREEPLEARDPLLGQWRIHERGGRTRPRPC
jgi:hypothetical protein